MAGGKLFFSLKMASSQEEEEEEEKSEMHLTLHGLFLAKQRRRENGKCLPVYNLSNICLLIRCGLTLQALWPFPCLHNRSPRSQEMMMFIS